MPHFLYDNVLRSATVVSEDTLTNFEFANCVNGNTSSQMGLATGADRDVVLDLGVSKTFDYVCVAAHNLSGTTLTLAGSADDVGYTDIDTVVYGNNYVLVDQITQASYRFLRLRFSGHAGDIYISDLFIGAALEWPHPMPFGFSPPEDADEDLINSNRSGGGALLGQSVEVKPIKIKVPLVDVLESWFDAYWNDFKDSIKRSPGYFVWRDGARALYFTPFRRIGSTSYTAANRKSITLTVEGFIE